MTNNTNMERKIFVQGQANPVTFPAGLNISDEGIVRVINEGIDPNVSLNARIAWQEVTENGVTYQKGVIVPVAQTKGC